MTDTALRCAFGSVMEEALFHHPRFEHRFNQADDPVILIRRLTS